MNKDDLKARTKRFALRVMSLVEALPKTASGRAIGNQLVRSGTGVGSNYLPTGKVEPLLKEANELVKIMAASRISAARRKQSAIANRKSEI